MYAQNVGVASSLLVEETIPIYTAEIIPMQWRHAPLTSGNNLLNRNLDTNAVLNVFVLQPELQPFGICLCSCRTFLVASVKSLTPKFYIFYHLKVNQCKHLYLTGDHSKAQD